MLTSVTLSLAHSTGDSDSIIAVNRQLKARHAGKLLILALGPDAKKRLAEKIQNDEDITVINLDELINLDTFSKSLSLTDQQVKAIMQIMRESYGPVAALLSGIPSETATDKSRIQEQFCAAYQRLQVKVAVIIDYLFFDIGHSFYQHAFYRIPDLIFVPLLAAMSTIPQEYQNKLLVSGHSAIDTALQNAQTFHANRTEQRVREKLGVTGKLIFIAGGKQDDEAMIESLMHVVRDQPDIQVRIGLHPGASSEYIDKIRTLTAAQSSQVQLIDRSFKLSSDEVAFSANATLSVSSTVSTVAALFGCQAGFFQPNFTNHDNPFYITKQTPKAQIYRDKSDLLVLVNKLNTPKKPLQKSDLNLHDSESAEFIADKVCAMLT